MGHVILYLVDIMGKLAAGTVLFATYSTLRSGAGVNATAQSRLQQLLDWLGRNFQGVIVFDESPTMENTISSVSEWGM